MKLTQVLNISFLCFWCLGYRGKDLAKSITASQKIIIHSVPIDINVKASTKMFPEPMIYILLDIMWKESGTLQGENGTPRTRPQNSVLWVFNKIYNDKYQ